MKSAANSLNARDSATFTEIYSRFAKLLRHIGRQYQVAPCEIDELVQDAFLKLIESEGSFADLSAVKGFLAVTMRRAIIDRSRRQKARKTECYGDDLPVSVEHEKVSPIVGLEYEKAVAAIGEMVKKIAAEATSPAFELFYVNGCSVKEISAQTGEAVGSVTAKLCRMRQKYSASMREEVENLALAIP